MQGDNINYLSKLASNFRANSVTWNPHKLLGSLLQCSTLHVRENVSKD